MTQNDKCDNVYIVVENINCLEENKKHLTDATKDGKMNESLKNDKLLNFEN
ncbi:hypothetical protein IZY60_15285 [Lutibacter sp. B2]|nr:hypothetical protein [Lutibacter sp. B2]